MICVKRDTGIVGILIKLDVYIDGIKVGSLVNNEERTFEVEKDEVVLQVGFANIRSKPITLPNGKTALAKGSILGSIFWPFGLKSSYLVIAE